MKTGPAMTGVGSIRRPSRGHTAMGEKRRNRSSRSSADVHVRCGCTPVRWCLLFLLRMRALAGLIRGSTCESTLFDGSEATQSAALTFNVPHLLIALPISGATEIGTSKTAAAGSAEHDAVAAANKLRAAVVDRFAVDRHKAEPT